MSDETFRETANQTKDDCAKGETWIAPQEAAAQLGISVRAVQIRAQRGTLLSRRQNRKLYVCLTHADAAGTRNDGETLRETTQQGETPGETGVQLLLTHQSEEIAFLRGRIEAHEEERRRRDIAEGEIRRLMLADKTELQTLRQKVALLIAPMETTGAASEEVPEPTPDPAELTARTGEAAPEPPRRAWWVFRRR